MGLPHKSEPKNSYCVIWVKHLNTSTLQRPEGVSSPEAQGLKARHISAPSRKGGVSMFISRRRAEGLN